RQRDRGTGRQGEGGTGRQGVFTFPLFPLSPCLLVSLSPCLLVSSPRRAVSPSLRLSVILASCRIGFGVSVQAFGISHDLMRGQPHGGDDRDPAIGRRHWISKAFAPVASSQQSLLRVQHAPDAKGLSVGVIPGDEDSAVREAGGVRVFSDLLALIE